jgi:DNA-binding YbaB/EbfC family protein
LHGLAFVEDAVIEKKKPLDGSRRPHGQDAHATTKVLKSVPVDITRRNAMFDVNQLMKQAQEMQGKMAQMQEELARKQITADAGAGMVQATVNGRMELMKIKIDKSKIDLNDIELLEDVIVAAVAAAQNRAGQNMKQEMQKAAGDMGLPPGLLG